ncbi:MAG: hypothetical protein M1822_008253 [Bathelium mastoideum]|nr:MAG: hypothetical protein M1822_008253 [Bathelium mastoideum]
MGRAMVSPPVAAGKRLMTSIIDDVARSDPERCFMSILENDDKTNAFRNISYACFARAIDRSAWWIEGLLGKGVGFPSIATYLSPMDFRHVILIFAAIKTGYKMFYSSPRNRPEVQVALLEKLQCTRLFAPEEMSEAAKIVLEHRKMSKYILPDLEYFLSEEPVEPYPYSKPFEEARKDPYVVLHSSGTTGTPKIIVLKQGTVAAHDAFHLLPSLGEKPWYGSNWASNRVVVSFPWLHAGGVLALSCSIYHDFTIVNSSDWPLTGAAANRLHVSGNVQAAWCSPSVLIELAQNPAYLQNLSKLSSVSYAGGILPQHVGDTIAKHTRLFGTFASTETGILPGAVPPQEDWNYYHYSERLGYTFRYFAEDMYELVFTRNPALEPFQGIFYTFPDADTYAMSDLYIPHPTRPGWWRSSGRVDDVVVCADAKKINVIPYEAVIEAHPAVATALICGTGRIRPAVLLQPTEWPASEQEERELVDKVWPSFEKANEAGPVYGRLIKELVVVTKREKPMARAGGKDTVQRKRSIELYEEEIDQAYKRAEKMGLVYGEDVEPGKLV